MLDWSTIKYFKPWEFDSPDLPGSGKNMQESFIKKLDRARTMAKIPFVITSGFRTTKHNEKVGGVGNSSHLTGWSADIRAKNDRDRRLIVNSLIAVGLNRRLGFGSNFVHVDDDPSKAEAYWTYQNEETLKVKEILEHEPDTIVELPPFEVEMELIKATKNTDWSHDFYDIEGLHKTGRKGKGVIIGVLDTGVDLNHPSFNNAVKDGRLMAFDARQGKDEPYDNNGHGTWVVSRYVSDNVDVLGFAPECTVKSYKVLNDNGSGALTDVIRGIEMAIDDGCHIISTSLGWPNNVPEFQSVVNRVKSKGILWVSASGNDGKDNDIDYPALYNSVISIGSHNDKNKRSKFSDFGLDLDIYSSGESVRGAYTKNRVATLNGTSMATPSFGALLATVYFDIIKKYGDITRNVLKQNVTCQKI